MSAEQAGGGRVRGSVYQQWSKTRSHARFNLATSGVANYTFAELGAEIGDVELSGPSLYGYGPLQEALAAKNRVPVGCVVAAAGTSMANHLVMAAVLDAGDEVLVEHPAYEPILAAARYLGARVRTFKRRFGENFRIDPGEVARALTPRTRLVVLTNLHNPSSAYADEGTLTEVGRAARAAGARVLVDEVYLDALFERAPLSAFHLGEEFVVTSSLTKVYGLSGLRCGWVLADAELAQRLWHLNDLFGVIPAHPAERLSVVALANLERIAARSRALLAENRRLLDDFLATRGDLEWRGEPVGTVIFPRLAGVNVDEFCARLAAEYETSVVPGRFFGMPEHIRLGIGGDTAQLEAGLERVGRCLDEMRR